MKTPILAFLCALSTAFLASGQVPSLINYQGRLTDANGAAVTGNKNFSINIFDAATGGNLLYSETIGAVTLDSNGVYSFQFGSAGTSNKQETETIGTTAGTTLVYSKALANSSVVNNSITVTDGTNSWSQSVGNPGAGATATANTIVGFVIGATITNGGSGYTSAPEVTISGNGTGATATATLTDGVVTGITIVSAGSGYTTGATITIAPPVIPFRVEYSSGAITATYATAPNAGRTIAATYRYGTSGIADALGNAGEQWMAITVDGVTQGARQRVLTVPFAQRAGTVAEIDETLLDVTTLSLLKTSKSVHDLLTEANGQITSKLSYLVSPNLPIQPVTTESPLGSIEINSLLRYVTINNPGPGAFTHTAVINYADGTPSVSMTKNQWYYNLDGSSFWTFVFDNPHPNKIVSSVQTSGGDSKSTFKCVLNGPQDYEFPLPSNLAETGRFFVSVATSNPQLMGNFSCSLLSSDNEIISSSNNGILLVQEKPSKVKVTLFPSNFDPVSRSHVGIINSIRITRVE